MKFIKRSHLKKTERRELTSCYTIIFEEMAKDYPAIGPIVLVRQRHDDPQRLKQGIIKAFEVLALSAFPDSDMLPSLRQSLSDYCSIPWITDQQVKGLLTLAVRSGELSLPEVKAKMITLDCEGRATLKVYNHCIRLEKGWWVVRTHSGRDRGRSQELSAAITQARI